MGARGPGLVPNELALSSLHTISPHPRSQAHLPLPFLSSLPLTCNLTPPAGYDVTVGPGHRVRDHRTIDDQRCEP